MDTIDQHQAYKRGLQAERRRRRMHKGLGERLDKALIAALALSEAPSGTTEGRVTRGKPGATAPPDASGLLYGSNQGSIHDVFKRRLRLMIELLEREVDGQLARPSVDARETREEKDRRLVEDFRGEPPHLVSFMDPSMGSPRSVERARVRMKVRPIDGEEIQEREEE